ncbi:MAG: Na-Ca exchanger/integrin-beta4 [Thermoleophilia bacterium]|nr:Na-Ca exchanger/integrin-beta4 [Thermoleophilia bacterium]
MLTSAHRIVIVLAVSMLAAVVAGLAQPARAIAEPAVGITQGGGAYYLVTFDTAGGPLTSQRLITGLTRPDYVGFTMRPSTGGLVIAVSADQAGANDTIGSAFTLDFATAIATPMATANFSLALHDNTARALSVNPVTDEIRMTSVSSENLRINATTGALIANDTALSGGARGTALAYDRQVAGATATTLWGIDTNSAKLTRIGGVDGVPAPDGGQTLQVGTTGVSLSSNGGFSISPSTGIGYISNAAAGVTNIHTVNFTTGFATSAGVVHATLLDVVLLPPAAVQVAAPTAAVVETDGSAIVTVTRSGDLRLPASVQYATSDGTATAGTDYLTSSGTLDFAAGVTSRVVSVPLVPSSAFEGGETFAVTLSAAAGAASLGGGTTTVTITDPADAIAPKVLALPLAARRVRTVGLSGIIARFSSSEAGTVRVRLLLGTKLLGSAKPVTLTLTGAGIGAVRVKPTALGQKRLVAAVRVARTHRVKLVYVLSVTDPSGNARVVRLPVLVVR